ncbi:lipid droplet-associated hydrolase [Orussus abietinus]|uniref:lipid droplet-associated hydrolase n=1 Tax=Orussus abietinus TaxID=222816 RepID=UPI0006268D64|nr:lipid droplet-associated hydrolase [Orussus abietinus]
MQEAMIPINGVPTHVMTQGCWIEEDLAPGGCKDIVVLITGNPGIPEFYKGFIKSLKEKLPSETPVWVVGHAGHVQPPKLLHAKPSDIPDKQLYDMKGQYDHKMQFIKKYVPKDARLHLVGHSIGSWFILNLLRDEEIEQRTVKCYLLFPTIENMLDTPNGKFYTSIVSWLIPVLLIFTWIFSCFPYILQFYLVRLFGIFYGIPAKSIKAVLQLLNYTVLNNVFMLANEELQRVRELDHNVIEKHASKLWFYYGTRDGWVPVSYYENLKACHPKVDAVLCKRRFYHSFVLNNDVEMGYIVADKINEMIDQSHS